MLVNRIETIDVQFDNVMWMSIFLTLFLLMVAMAAVSYYNVKIRRVQNPKEYLFKDLLSWYLGVIAQQGFLPLIRH